MRIFTLKQWAEAAEEAEEEGDPIRRPAVSIWTVAVSKTLDYKTDSIHHLI